MAVVATVAGLGNPYFPGAAPQATYFNTAMAVLGNPVDYGTLWLDFAERGVTDGLPAGWVQSSAGAAPVSTGANAGTKGGMSRMGVINAASNNAHTQTSGSYLVGNVGTDFFYYAGKFYIDGTLDASQMVSHVISNAAGTRSFGVGFYGNASVTNWRLAYNGNYGGPTATSDLGAVALSTAVTMEFWVRGATIYGRKDGGAIVSAATPAPPSDSCQFLYDVRNGISTPAQSMYRDWSFMVFPR